MPVKVLEHDFFPVKAPRLIYARRDSEGVGNRKYKKPDADEDQRRHQGYSKSLFLAEFPDPNHVYLGQRDRDLFKNTFPGNLFTRYRIADDLPGSEPGKFNDLAGTGNAPVLNPQPKEEK